MLQKIFRSTVKLYGRPRSKRPLEDSPEEPLDVRVSDFCRLVFELNPVSFAKNKLYIGHFLNAVSSCIDKREGFEQLSFAEMFPRDYDPVSALQLFGIAAKIRQEGPPRTRAKFDIYAKTQSEVYVYIENITWSILNQWMIRLLTETPPSTCMDKILLLLGGRYRINPDAGFMSTNPLNNCRLCKIEIQMAKDIAATESSEAELGPIQWERYEDNDAQLRSPFVLLSQRRPFPMPEDEVRWLKKSRTFCCVGCKYMHILSSSSQMLRHRIEIRDQLKCAMCLMDIGELMQNYKTTINTIACSRDMDSCLQAWFSVSPWKDSITQAIANRIKSRIQKNAFMETSRRRTFGLRMGDLWQVDHILPVKIGGGSTTTLFNLRSLCAQCHRDVTKELAQYKLDCTMQADEGSPEKAQGEVGTSRKRRKGMKRWYGKL